MERDWPLCTPPILLIPLTANYSDCFDSMQEHSYSNYITQCFACYCITFCFRILVVFSDLFVFSMAPSGAQFDNVTASLSDPKNMFNLDLAFLSLAAEDFEPRAMQCQSISSRYSQFHCCCTKSAVSASG